MARSAEFHVRAVGAAYILAAILHSFGVFSSKGAAVSKIACPGCRAELTIDSSMVGRRVQCPSCSHQFVIPGGEKPPQIPAAQPYVPPAPAFSAPTSYSNFASKRFKQSDSIFDIILDFRFEKYVTPWIVRITWIVVLVVGAIMLLLQIGGDISSLLPDGSNSRQPNFDFQPRGELVYRLVQFGQILLRYSTLFIGLLWIRVVLETMIVIFHIAQSLASIDRKTRE